MPFEVETVKGQIPWNKGIKTGLVPRSAFQKGHKPYNKNLTLKDLEAQGKQVGSWPKGIPRANETNEKIGKANKGKTAWNKGLTRQQAEVKGKRLAGGRPIGGTPWNKGKHGEYPEETLQKISRASKGRILSPRHKEQIKMSLIGKECKPETRQKIGKKNQLAMRRKWQDPEYILTQLRLRGARPNKIEKRVEAILNRQFPQFKYNGDGRLGVVLARLVPDFVNVNGQKEIIEVFGKHWHNRPEMRWHQTELGRIMAYNSVGFRCLVIWEHELKNEETVIAKIKQFME